MAYRYYPGLFSWPYFLLSLAAILLLHAGAIAFNDYFDFRSGADVIDRERTPFTGGTGLLVDGTLKPYQVLAAGSLCFAVCIAIGMYIVFTRSPDHIPVRRCGRSPGRLLHCAAAKAGLPSAG